MHDKRIKIFILISVLLLVSCFLRLTQMQLVENSYYQDRITKLKLQKGVAKQLKTLRGNILDRTGKVMAADEPQFLLCISYKLTKLLDDRLKEVKDEGELENLKNIIRKCAQFKGVETSEIESDIRKINDRIWNGRLFQAWRRNFPDSEILQRYENITSIPLSAASDDFEKQKPDLSERLKLIKKIDIAEMYDSRPLVELKTDDDIFTAQLEFLDIDGIGIFPKAKRYYPYNSAAAQTIGWVGPHQTSEKKLFEGDRLASYLTYEISGRRPGVEYTCETILRGKRGEIFYDIDRKLQSLTKTEFGESVSLTLDIELQQKIENYLTDCNLSPHCDAPIAAVVIDVATGDILALVSVPVFDLNRIRYDYPGLASDANEPLRNRALYKQYPPGSVIKPFILIAGLETNKITPDEIISCAAKKSPKGWPNCLIIKQWIGHDDKWYGEGGNKARNAIKGSCNVYFSRLADRLDGEDLQRWLFNFGFGRKILPGPVEIREKLLQRNLKQAQGKISTAKPKANVSTVKELPAIATGEKRYFGIGQGNMRATPLQIANGMAAIARGGLFKSPRLFIGDANDPAYNSISLNISPRTLETVYDGMGAVVNEEGGTYYQFAPAGFDGQDVKVYGKTGSTENPDNALFAGFAEDSTGRSIAIAVLVEGGQRGSTDAAPIARDIIQFCIDANYIGQLTQ